MLRVEVHGPTKSGKTTVMQVIRRALAAHGMSVIFLDPDEIGTPAKPTNHLAGLYVEVVSKQTPKPTFASELDRLV
jgi:Ni2+-binding GTPase involved in maturation of urease and hydrogenase